MANNVPVTKAWVDNLGQTVREGKDYGQIIGKPPLTPQEYAMQNARYDIERGAQMERPTYGMWNGETFISTDPNEIAEMNARSEMRRTGLDRYYRPQSGPYFEAFNKIRDRYLQQELGKKAAMEAEGRGIVANRLGAFDKILQERAEAAKNSGLNALREAQAKEALAKAGNEERPKGQKVEKQHRDVFEDAMHQHFSQYLDIPTKNLNETMTALVDDGNYGKTTFQNTMIKGTNIPVSLLYNKGLSAYETAISQGFTTGDAVNIASAAMQRYISDSKIKAPKAEGVSGAKTVKDFYTEDDNKTEKKEPAGTTRTFEPQNKDDEIPIPESVKREQEQYERTALESLGLSRILNSPEQIYRDKIRRARSSGQAPETPAQRAIRQSENRIKLRGWL